MRWPELYYAATIVFAGIDATFGANVRAVGFAHAPELRFSYYAFCLACGMAIHARPAWTAPIVMGESVLNLTALMASLLLPYYALAESVARDGVPTGSPFSLALLLNFLLAGGAAVGAFYHSLYTVQRRLSRSSFASTAPSSGGASAPRNSESRS